LLARFLVEHGADVAAQDKQRFTPLLSLSSTGNVNFPSFLNLSDNVAARDADFDSLLFEPLESAPHVDLAKFLVENGADVVAPDDHGSTHRIWHQRIVTMAHATLQTDQSTTV